MAVLLTALAALLAPVARGHDAAETVPDVVGLQLGAGVALTGLAARDALPAQRLPGVLVRGDPGVDRRKSLLEHAVFDATWRWSAQGMAHIALGRHDHDPVHLEAAWWRQTFRLGSAMSGSIQIGRMTRPMGAGLTEAGHFDRWSLMPLARQMALDGGGIDDGVQLGATTTTGRAMPAGGWQIEAHLGLWRARHFPGGRGATPAPSVHLGVSRGSVRGDVSVLFTAPEGRGAQSVSLTGAHTHNAPDCRTPQNGVLCFAGDSRIIASQVAWEPADGQLSAQASYWRRDDQGTLQSVNGQARHTARYQGGWLQLLWRPLPVWRFGLRAERLQGRVRVQGAGATLVAQEAGFPGAAPIQRLAAVASWQPWTALTLSAELGQEAQDSRRVPFAILRLVWRETWTVWSADASVRSGETPTGAH